MLADAHISLPPYLLPLSTPATQAILVVNVLDLPFVSPIAIYR